MAKKKQLKKNGSKAKTNKECFNCEKKNYYAKDWCSPASNKRKSENLSKKLNRFDRKKIKQRLLN